MRVERPAASTTAAMRRAPPADGSSRGCGRVTISISNPPTPMPVIASRGTSMPASSRMSTQSKPFSLGERAQPGAPSTGRSRARATRSRFPGSTGIPKCSTRPPIVSTAAGITSRRSAIAEAPNTITSSAPAPSTSSIALASARWSCDTRRSATIMDLANAIGRDADERTGRFCRRKGAIALLGCDRERNDLDRGDHLADDDRLVGGQRRKRDRLVDVVEPIDRPFVHHQHARVLREQIGAAGEGAIDAHPLPSSRCGDLGSGGVLRDISRLDPRHHDLANARSLQRGDLVRADQGALFQDETALADRMHRDPARGLADRDRAEFHGVFSRILSGVGIS